MLGFVSISPFHSSFPLTVSSWELGAGMDLGPGAWGKLLKGTKALGWKNWRQKKALIEFSLADMPHSIQHTVHSYRTLHNHIR